MSAVRNERRGTRLSKPYQRDVPEKKSSWSLSGLLSFLNPLRSNELEEEQLPLTNAPSAEMLAARGSQMAQHIADQPRSTNPLPPPPPSNSQSKLAEAENPMLSIDKYLEQKKTLNETETQELMKFVHQHVAPVKKHEPFRFTSVPAVTNSQSMPSLNQQQAPRRALSRNPNGVYRWEGGGSSKRNRYRSAAFGTTSTASGLKLRPPLETPKTDTKRRRVGNDAEAPMSALGVRSAAPSPQSKPNTPAKPAPPTTPEKVSGSRSMPSLRVATPVKPSVPAIPSPLRQAWSQSDSPPTRQTKAASFMAELIKEVVPPPKPDVSNPYQTVCPVKPQGQPRKVSARRTRSTAKASKPSLESEKETGKAKEPEKEKEPELPPHALIEATVPKGSKRSRPPTKSALETTEDPAEPASKLDEIMEVEGPSIEEPAQKKPKKAMLNGHGFPPAQPSSVSYSPIVVEEVDDVDTPSVTAVEVVEPTDDTSKSTGPPTVQVNVNGASKHSGALKSSLPREPSKLRFSYQPEVNGSPTSSPSPAAEKENQAIPPPPLPTDAKSVARSTATVPTFDFHVPTPSSPLSKAKQAALKATLTSFDFTVDPTSMSSSSAAAIAAASAKKGSLPSFEFTTVPTPTPVNTSNASSVGFDWAKAGMKAPEAKDGWTCSECMCSNPPEAKDKCTVCDATAPAAASSSKDSTAPTIPSASTSGFDWSAAGMKAPEPKAGWICSQCMCSNPSEATDKCTVCEAPAPGVKATPPAPSGGFNWAAAGMAPPATELGWTCGTCSCLNPPNAQAKCTVCDTPAPASVQAS